MKKNLIISLILVLVVLVGAYILFFQNPLNSKEEISQFELITNVFPLMETYCQNLESQVTNSACPTCRYPKMFDCDFVNESELENGDDVCLIKKIDENYSLRISRHLIYGSNTRMGHVALDFILDKEGNIISQNLPEMPCL